MNKTAIKNFAVWARQKLISDITYKAGMLGITENGIAEKLPQSTADLHFYDIGTKNYAEASGIEIKQRDALVKAIKNKELSFKTYKDAFDNVVEEAAYTWFNRLIAIRFMEVNDYLPSGIRVLSSENKAKNEPDFVTTPFDTDMEFTPFEQDRIIQFKDENKLDELFRMLFIKQCNKLHDILPDLFEKTDDYSELLLTISFTDKDGIVYRLVHDIDEDDFNVEKEGQVEIIGWMYQYYNIEPKDETFALLKKNVKITKERIPAATQLFTPDWIVRYMVENSLGRIFISDKCSAGSEQFSENERIEKEKKIADEMGWKYYLPEAEQTPEVRTQLTTNHSSLTTQLTSLKLIDPCMGSGHILVYCFDVLMQIYESQGYTQRDAAQSILENNLFGLDIDKRAAQLAYFAVMMKARQYDRRIFGREVKPQVYAIEESNGINRGQLQYFGANLSPTERNKAKTQVTGLLDTMVDAKEYGSILNVENYDWELLKRFAGSIDNASQMTFDTVGIEETQKKLLFLIKLGQMMAQKYDVVATNPPYMGSSGMGAGLSKYVKDNYPDSKSDLFAVFIERCKEMLIKNGYQAMITQHAWMFLSSYEKLRGKLLLTDLVNMAHLGARAFDEIGGEVVQTTSFVMRKSHITSYKGEYCRLIEPTTQQGKEDMFLAGENRYEADQSNFSKIPGSPVAYWVSDATLKAYANPSLHNYMDCKSGIMTGSDEYIRLWYEPAIQKIKFDCRTQADMGDAKFFPLNSGGDFRKWYGNNTKVVNLWHNGIEIKSNVKNYRLRDPMYYFRRGITWGRITSSQIAFREVIDGSLFGDAGPIGFIEGKRRYALGFLSSKVVNSLLQATNPTLNFQVHDIMELPLIVDQDMVLNVESIVSQNIETSKSDWDSFETSWDFEKHPLVRNVSTVAEAFEQWQNECNTRFNQLKANEEELNRIFIDIYGLQDELTPDVEDKDVTVRKADLQRDVKSLISYAVGCMFGRYSLDVDGLAYAGGGFSDQWIVISGQYYKREVIENYVIDELQRIDSMAEIYGFSDRGLQASEASAERRNVCTLESNETGGSINSVEYRRGTSTKLYEGIRELSFNCKRVESGAGNTAYDLCSPEILDAISNGSGDELVARGWKDANRIDWKAIHSKLITNHYCPDADNCIPITDEEYFEDDIVGLLCEWLKKAYGEKTLEENLDFIANALGNKGNTSREIIRNYFLNDFMKDHIKIYQKRPIYWLFDSGKQNGFKALVYMHRWNADTIGNMRVEYLHRMQRVYDKEIERMQEVIDNSHDNKEIAAANKRKEKLQKQIKETKDYDAKVAHLALSRIDIDLDDGVKVNYEKVQAAPDGKKMQILAKI